MSHRVFIIEISAPVPEDYEPFWTWLVSTEDGFLVEGESISAEDALKAVLNDLKGMNEI